MHHRYYLHGKDPWEYPLEALVTLCESCHEEETQERGEAERRLLFALRQVGFYASGVRTFADAFARIANVNSVGADITASVIEWVLGNPLQLRLLELRYFDDLSRRLHGEDSDQYKRQHETSLANIQELEQLYHEQDITQIWPPLADRGSS